MADEILYKFTDMRDAENVPIEKLRDEVARLKALSVFFETKQLAIKKFINSVYGALGSKYFIAYNTQMAESITAQGRELNHYSENSVNDYFEGIFQSNPKIILYYHWVHYDADGTRWTFRDKDKFPDFYNVGKWEECKSWEPAVKKGKKMTPDLISCLKDNSTVQCDWFQTQTTLFKKLGISEEVGSSFDIDKGRTTKTEKLTGKDFEYLTNKHGVSMIVGGDTDSVAGNSMLDVYNGKNKYLTRISDLFDSAKEAHDDIVLNVPNGSEVIPAPDGMSVRSYDDELDMAIYKPIRYVMRHRVSKARYKITTESGRTVIVTGDHSCIVVRDGELIAVKACEIDPDRDKIMVI